MLPSKVSGVIKIPPLPYLTFKFCTCLFYTENVLPVNSLAKIVHSCYNFAGYSRFHS